MGVLVQHSGHDVLLAAAFTSERDASDVVVVGHAESEIGIGNSIIKLQIVWYTFNYRCFLPYLDNLLLKQV